MEIIKEDGFRKLIKSGLSGGYLFFGDEDYLKSYSLKSAREAICADEGFAVFNDITIDPLDYSAPALLDALMPLPMMSEQKIVTINGLHISQLKPTEIDDLCDVLEALREYDYNVLIISVPSGAMDEGNLPKSPSATLQKLAAHLTPVRFEAVTPARLVSWLGKHFAHNGAEATPQVCSFMISYCGSSMFTLAAECDKLSYYALAHGRKNVTEEDVKTVCSADLSADSFALANAILDGRSDKALDVLAVMKFRRIDPIVVLSEVSKVVCDMISIRSLMDSGKSSSEIATTLKMNEYKVKIYMSAVAAQPMKKLRRTLELCTEADIALKLSPQGYMAIERLVCSL